jgi:hypothetical protein
VLYLGLSDLFQHLSQGLIEDPKLTISVDWLRSRLGPSV